ncbi:MAG: hypothetical protein PHR04_05265 [Syntrophomonadaceae bacterium]|nr:hypothetical protein [Syntrophomonadaceae bacterium]
MLSSKGFKQVMSRFMSGNFNEPTVRCVLVYSGESEDLNLLRPFSPTPYSD